MKRIAALAMLLALAGCGTSRNYQFYPDDAHKGDSPTPQDVQCGHVDLVIQSVTGQEHIEVGRFCKEPR